MGMTVRKWMILWIGSAFIKAALQGRYMSELDWAVFLLVQLMVLSLVAIWIRWGLMDELLVWWIILPPVIAGAFGAALFHRSLQESYWLYARINWWRHFIEWAAGALLIVTAFVIPIWRMGKGEGR